MKLKLIFTIAAVYGVAVGLGALLFPDQLSPVDLTDAGSMTVRFVGVANLGLGLIAWLVRNTDASKTRDGVTLGFTVFFALAALTSLYGAFTDDSTSGHWYAASLQALIAVGFFMAGRASMAATAKSSGSET